MTRKNCRAVYVTRGNSDNPCGTLHGGARIAEYLQEIGLEVIYTPYKSSRYEASDFLAYSMLDSLDWSQYAVIIYGEPGFAPFFQTAGIKAFLYMNAGSWWPDASARDLRRYSSFVERVIVPTPEMAGVWYERDIPIAILPPPIPDQLAAGFTSCDRDIDVIWVGRPTAEKGFYDLVDVAHCLPKVQFTAYIPYHERPSHMPDNIRLLVGQGRPAYDQAKVSFVSSYADTFNLAMAESGMAGCTVICHRAKGLLHAYGLAHYYYDLSEAIRLIEECVGLPPDRKPGWFQRYSAAAVSQQWHKFIEGGGYDTLRPISTKQL